MRSRRHDDGLRLELNPAREAIRSLAVEAMFDALESGDREAFERTSRELVALNRRLFDEEAAERGYMPQSIEGMIGVLRVAARIVELIGDNGGL